MRCCQLTVSGFRRQKKPRGYKQNHHGFVLPCPACIDKKTELDYFATIQEPSPMITVAAESVFNHRNNNPAVFAHFQRIPWTSSSMKA
jgi:hypothetical protein